MEHGVDGGREQGLIGEDGAIEVAKGGFSIEPFVVSDGKLLGWADVHSSQSLQDGYLPIPTARWEHADFALETTAFAQGDPERAQLLGRYRLTNTSARTRDYVLVLAARPFQVNPPSQFLNTVGGVSAVREISVRSGGFASAGAATRDAGRGAPAASSAGGSVLGTVLSGAFVGWRAGCGAVAMKGALAASCPA